MNNFLTLTRPSSTAPSPFVCVCMNVYICVCVRAYVCVHERVHMCMCVRAYVCVHVCVLLDNILTAWPKLALNSQQSPCLSFPSAEITDVIHHIQLRGFSYAIPMLADRPILRHK